MRGWVIGPVLVAFFLGGSDFLKSSGSSAGTRPGHLILVDAALAGGGFGVPKKRGGSNTTPASNKKKPKGRWIADVVPQSRTTTYDNKSDPTRLDKWGLPPPTVEDIFPLMPPGTELIPVESSKEYSLAEIQQALQHHIPLTKLALRFDKHGLERRTKASSSSAAVDNNSGNDAEQQQQQQPRMKLRLLHQSPPVLAIDHFLTPQECQELYQIAVPKNDNDIDTDTTPPNIQSTAPTTLPAVQVESKTFSVLAQSRRTSTSWFCYYESVPTLLAKIRDVLGLVADLHQMEEPQIVRYQSGQEFSWHYDEMPTPQLGNGGQRLATLLVYLNTVPDGGGGGTVFRDLRDCHGNTLTVQPVQGTALLFFPAFSDGRPDDRTLHRGEPILVDDAGTVVEKRIVQLWIHQGSYRAAVPPHNRQQDAVAAVDQVSRRLGYDTTAS